jgi:orotidine-5'-phosphate decarboxylase
VRMDPLATFALPQPTDRRTAEGQPPAGEGMAGSGYGSLMSGHDRLIVALDFPSHKEAISLVEVLGNEVHIYKVGLELLAAAGPEVVRELSEMGKSVFMDLKLHEIPSSVASAVRVCGQLSASMVTVHASAGSSVLSAAVHAAADFPGLNVLALTVITSLTDEGLTEVGVVGGVTAQVERLAALASTTGCQGVVVSPQEVAICRALLPPRGLVVVPGATLGSVDDGPGDHARVADATKAVSEGATHLVMGRSISRASDSRGAARRVIHAIELGTSTR